MNDDTIREKKIEQKLRFIEILLIVGGIISSLGLKNGIYVNEVFGSFLIGSLLYFFTLSNLSDVEVSMINYILTIFLFIMSILITAYTFSYLSILPLKLPNITLFILIMFLIIGNLWSKDILPKRNSVIK